AYEYELAKADGVRFEWFAQPVRVVGDPGRARGVEFVRTALDDPGSRQGAVKPVAGSEFVLPPDLIVKALGQESLLALLGAVAGVRSERGQGVVDRATGAATVPKLFAGGDCIRNGGEIVDAVQDGKVAAAGIHAALTR